MVAASITYSADGPAMLSVVKADIWDLGRERGANYMNLWHY